MNCIKKCRACLAIKESYNYYLFDNVSPETYRFCTSIEVCEEDKLTRALCDSCFELLEKLFIFKNTCILSQNKLASTLVTEENLDVKQECDTNISEEAIYIDSNVESEDDDDEETQGFSETMQPTNEMATIQNNSSPKSIIEDVNIFSSDQYEEQLDKSNDIFKAYKTVENERQMSHQNEKSKKPVCILCNNKIFMNNSALEDHILRNHRYSCHECKEQFKDNASLKKHLRLHKGRQIYKCDHCPKSYKIKDSLVEHLSHHTGERPHKCIYCEKTFIWRRNLNDHYKIHTGERPHKCKICNKAFRHKHYIKRHMKTHVIGYLDKLDSEEKERFLDNKLVPDISMEATKQSEISQCEDDQNNVIVKDSELEQRIKLMCKDANIWSHLCEACGKRFATRKLLKSHVSRYHQTKNYVCHFCEYSFLDEASLVEHVLTHKGKKVHSCDICLKSYASKISLIEHRRSHTGERPFKCSYCALSFMTKRHLVGHLKIHTGGKQHKCDICHRLFSQKVSLNRHMKTHETVITESIVIVEHVNEII